MLFLSLAFYLKFLWPAKMTDNGREDVLHLCALLQDHVTAVGNLRHFSVKLVLHVLVDHLYRVHFDALGTEKGSTGGRKE